MKVVHLCYYYGNGASGAPVAATRLHQALLRIGVESHYICVDQKEPGVNVHVLPKSRIANKIFYCVVRAFWIFSKLLTGKMLMPNVLPLVGLEKTIREINPDLIHVQYIGQDMMSFRQLAALPQPKVFTLHDFAIANAIEPHPCSDRRFEDGFNRENSSWSERWMFGRKQSLVSKTDMLFTGPSKWICGLFSRSQIGRGHSACVVQNIIDPAYSYSPVCRHPHKKFTILFGAYGGRGSPYKGWPDLESALGLMIQDVRSNTEVCVFGESAEPYELNGVKITFLGEILDPKILCEKYHSSDIFALPSRQDNAPQVKFEALMCGLPVLAFQRTGCAEYINPGENGWVAKDGDIAGYAAGIEYYYRLWHNGQLEGLRQKIADSAKVQFAENPIVAKMMAVYRQAINDSK